MEKLNKKKGLRPWGANLIAIMIEILICVTYYVLCVDAITSILSGDFVNAYSGVVNAIWFLHISIILISIIYLVVKPMRTKTTISLAIWNFFWVAVNFYIYFR